MFNDKKIKVDKALYAKLEQRAADEGYSSTDEFIRHVLEMQLADPDQARDERIIEQQLRGLGYLE